MKGEKKVQLSKNKSFSLIALFLVLTITATLVALPVVNAHDPSWNVPTYAYVAASPDPVGVSQTVTLVFWVDKIPPTAAGLAGDRWTFTVKVTTPEGTEESLGSFTSDPVGGSWASYAPDQVGTYTVTVSFPDQVVTGSEVTGIYNYNIAINDTYLASSATTTFTVQEEPIPDPPIYPLPTEYWMRPIEGQNTAWYTIASHWLGSPQIVGRVQPDGLAPNSAHVMWTKPIAFGGVVGGSNTGIEGITFYDGTAYESPFSGPIIMYGRLYYNLPQSDVSTGGGYLCVDLRTGEEIWYYDYGYTEFVFPGFGTFRTSNSPSFGQFYDYEAINQHGVIRNGYLWNSAWNAYDPLTGKGLFNLTGVPSGTSAYGPNGEILRYVLNSAGKWLALWNNTAAHGLTGASDPTDTTSSSFNMWRPVGKTVDASQAYSWNVTVPWLPTGATVDTIVYDDILLGHNGSLPAPGSWDPYTIWAMSLEPDRRGQKLWMKNYDAPEGNITRGLAPVWMSTYVDPETRVFTMYDKETMQWWGYSIDNGTLLWGPTPSELPLNYYSDVGLPRYDVFDGKLYSVGMSGMVYCYDLSNGELLWNYSAPSGLASPWPNWPFGLGAIADGKVYVFTTEHSANAPHWVGVKMRCINATNGDEVWALDSYGSQGSIAIADGYMIYLNLYDMQIYSIGKGPSATTVTASPKVSVNGDSVLIEGTVIDTAAGTDQDEQAARFPNGVPAVSDESMSAWMEYVYMQKPIPTDATGVEVVLETLDPNGNFYEIGRTTSDASGTYSYLFTPEVPGKYTITATFEGSESYWGSHAETAIGVEDAPQPTPTPTPTPAPMTDTYVLGIGAGAIIAIIVVGLVLIFMMRKR
jgi:outer membrane protein assembly factor BamB